MIRDWELIEKFKCYEYSTERNKNGTVSQDKLKKDICNLEGKKPNEYDLEHIVPVELFGHTFDMNNLRLMKKREHREKTRIDILIINFLKKTKIINNGSCGIRTYIEPENIKKLYLQLFDLIKESEKKNQAWFYGTVNINYEQVIIRNNRLEDKKDGGKDGGKSE
jgi:hypothetical protein